MTRRKRIAVAAAGVIGLCALAMTLTPWPGGSGSGRSSKNGLTTLDPRLLVDSSDTGQDPVAGVLPAPMWAGVMDPLDSLLLGLPAATGPGEIEIRTEHDRLVIELPVPDLKEASLQIHVDRQSLEVSGEQEVVQEERDASGRMVSRSESSSSYSSRFTLPEPVSPDGMTSRYKDGLLHIEIPRLYKET